MHKPLSFENFRYFTEKMLHTSKQICHLRKVYKMQAKKAEVKRNNKRRKINKIVNKIDKSKLNNTLNLIIKLPELSKKQINLISSIQQKRY
jgi:hypothetical protein